MGKMKEKHIDCIPKKIQGLVSTFFCLGKNQNPNLPQEKKTDENCYGSTKTIMPHCDPPPSLPLTIFNIPEFMDKATNRLCDSAVYCLLIFTFIFMVIMRNTIRCLKIIFS